MGLFYFQSMKIVELGDLFIVKIETGEGLLYRVTHDLVTPFDLVKTLTKTEVEKREAESKDT